MARAARTERIAGAEDAAGPVPDSRSFFEPRVRFSEDFGRRLEGLARRQGSSGRSLEGRGSGHIQGAGEEFTGFRPYRPGEDLRGLDWDLLARLDMPFVRTTRREATERWAILVDGSASMGVGPPPKYQRAAELSLALAHLAISGGRAEVLLRTNRKRSDGGPISELHLRRPEDWLRARAWFEDSPAGGNSRSAELFSGSVDAGRVIAIGDFLDAEPADLMRLIARGRELTAVCLLAPDEFVPPLGSAEFKDPESEETVAVEVDAELQAAFISALEARLEAFSGTCAKHRIGFVCRDTQTPFEDLVIEALEGRRSRKA